MFIKKFKQSLRGMATYSEAGFTFNRAKREKIEIVAISRHDGSEIKLADSGYETNANVDWNKLVLELKNRNFSLGRFDVFARFDKTGALERLSASDLPGTEWTVAYPSKKLVLYVAKSGDFSLSYEQNNDFNDVQVAKLARGIRNEVLLCWKKEQRFINPISVFAKMRNLDSEIKLVNEIELDFVDFDFTGLISLITKRDDNQTRFDLYLRDEMTHDERRIQSSNKIGKTWTQLIQLRHYTAEATIYVAKSGELSLVVEKVNLPYVTEISESGIQISRPSTLLNVPLSVSMEIATGKYETYAFAMGDFSVRVPFSFLSRLPLLTNEVKGLRALDDDGRIRGIMSTLPATYVTDQNGTQWLISGNSSGRLNVRRTDATLIKGSSLIGTKLSLFGDNMQHLQVVYHQNRTKQDYVALQTKPLKNGLQIDLSEVYAHQAEGGVLQGTVRFYFVDVDTSLVGNQPYATWRTKVHPVIVNPNVIATFFIHENAWQAQMLLSQSQNGDVLVRFAAFDPEPLHVIDSVIADKHIDFWLSDKLPKSGTLLLVNNHKESIALPVRRTKKGMTLDVGDAHLAIEQQTKMKKTSLRLLIRDDETKRLYSLHEQGISGVLSESHYTPAYPLTTEGLSMLRNSFQLRRSVSRNYYLNIGSRHNLDRRRLRFDTVVDQFEMTATGYKFGALINVPNATEFETESIFLVNRNKMAAQTFAVRTESLQTKDGVRVTATFDPRTDFLPIYLDVFVKGRYKGEDVVIQLRHASEEVQNYLRTNVFEKERNVKIPDVDAEGGTIILDYLMYPYITINGNLAFEFRQRKPFETLENQAREMAILSDMEKLYDLKRERFGDQKVWVIFEKNAQGGHDNGFHFFKYLFENHPEINAYFVIDVNSPDYHNLLPMVNRVLPFMSERYFETLATVDLLISSDTRYHVYNTNRRTSLMGQVLADKPLVYLQHGVNGLKQVPAFHKDHGLLDFVMVPDEYEKQMVVNQWGYRPDEIAVTGLARWDSYDDKTAEIPFKQIFVMPTWRKWMDGMTAERFVETPFYAEYNAFLNSQKLKQTLQENNARIAFFLHPYFKEYVHLFSVDDSIIDQYGYLDVDMGEEIMRSSMMVSDYSSVLWDMYYLKKPVVFYQFDQADYLRTEKAYMDYQTELFGDVAFDANQVIDEIVAYAGNGFVEKEQFVKLRDRYFTYMDHHNSERIYKAIKAKFN